MPLPHRTMARATDLSSTGAGMGYAYLLLGIGFLVGAGVGLFVHRPGDGAAIGGAVGLVAWVILLVMSYRRLRGYVGRHGDH